MSYLIFKSRVCFNLSDLKKGLFITSCTLVFTCDDKTEKHERQFPINNFMPSRTSPIDGND